MTLESDLLIKRVQYVVDEGGEPTAVLIDLKANSELWDEGGQAAVSPRLTTRSSLPVAQYFGSSSQ